MTESEQRVTLCKLAGKHKARWQKYTQPRPSTDAPVIRLNPLEWCITCEYCDVELKFDFDVVDWKESA